MATLTTPFGAAAVGGTNSTVAMSTSSKLNAVLALAIVFSIILIAIFVMNIVWAVEKTEDEAGSSGAEGEEEKKGGTTKGAAARNYIGAILSIVTLLTLAPGVYFNSTGSK